jgi:hypothetical protein
MKIDFMGATMTAVTTSRFQAVLASVESLPTDDQAMLAEVVTKRVAARRRRQLTREISQARQDYRRGKVHRGTAADFISELSAR